MENSPDTRDFKYLKWMNIRECEFAAHASLSHFYINETDGNMINDITKGIATTRGYSVDKCKSPCLVPVAMAFHTNIIRLFSIIHTLPTMFLGGKNPANGARTCVNMDEVIKWMNLLTPRHGGWFQTLMELQIVDGIANSSVLDRF
jgi:hypothetical protein